MVSSTTKLNGVRLGRMIIAGANELASNKQLVDAMNVFPVPDGDTGTNMSLTVMAAAREAEKNGSLQVADIAKAASGGALRGARGNSGVITSQIFRGFAKALEGMEEAGAQELAAAAEQAVKTAYKAVMKPKEGTILTVARGCAEAAVRLAEETDEIEVFLKGIIEEGHKVLAQTPEMLPVLKQAGVVDAGGQGIMIIFEGMGKVFHGEPMVAGGEGTPNKAKLSTENAGKGVFTDDLMKVEDIKNGYCTQFLINKYEGASAAKMRAFAESNGDSVVCIEDDDVINLHVHTADPGKILSEAIKYGYLTNFKIENMHEQFLARQKQGNTRPGISEEKLIQAIASTERNSTHPIAKTITSYAGQRQIPLVSATDITEIAGHGLEAMIDGQHVLVGNTRLLSKYKVEYPQELSEIADTIAVCAINSTYA